MHIEVMLMDNVKKLGKAGEIVKVAPGYFRNYLAPKGLASVATEAAKRRLKKLEAERAARAAEEKKAALAVAKKLEGLALTVSANTTDGKKLYGAVSVTDLLAASATAFSPSARSRSWTKARPPNSRGESRPSRRCEVRQPAPRSGDSFSVIARPRLGEFRLRVESPRRPMARRLPCGKSRSEYFGSPKSRNERSDGLEF